MASSRRSLLMWRTKQRMGWLGTSPSGSVNGRPSPVRHPVSPGSPPSGAHAVRKGYVPTIWYPLYAGTWEIVFAQPREAGVRPAATDPGVPLRVVGSF